eukprot:s5782_g5.t1
MYPASPSQIVIRELQQTTTEFRQLLASMSGEKLKTVKDLIEQIPKEVNVLQLVRNIKSRFQQLENAKAVAEKYEGFNRDDTIPPNYEAVLLCNGQVFVPCVPPLSSAGSKSRGKGREFPDGRNKGKGKRTSNKGQQKQKQKEKARLMARAKDRASRNERAKVDSVMCASVSDKSNEVAVEVEGNQNIPFLDLQLSIDDQARISHELFIKPQNLFHYVPFTSCHPPFVFKGAVQGEFQRYVRRCASQKVANVHVRSLRQRLLRRGYPLALLAQNTVRRVQRYINKPALPVHAVIRYSRSVNPSRLREVLRPIQRIIPQLRRFFRVQKRLFRLLYAQWR